MLYPAELRAQPTARRPEPRATRELLSSDVGRVKRTRRGLAWSNRMSDVSGHPATTSASASDRAALLSASPSIEIARTNPSNARTSEVFRSASRSAGASGRSFAPTTVIVSTPPSFFAMKLRWRHHSFGVSLRVTSVQPAFSSAAFTSSVRTSTRDFPPAGDVPRPTRDPSRRRADEDGWLSARPADPWLPIAPFVPRPIPSPLPWPHSPMPKSPRPPALKGVPMAGPHMS